MPLLLVREVKVTTLPVLGPTLITAQSEVILPSLTSEVEFPLTVTPGVTDGAAMLPVPLIDPVPEDKVQVTPNVPVTGQVQPTACAGWIKAVAMEMAIADVIATVEAPASRRLRDRRSAMGPAFLEVNLPMEVLLLFFLSVGEGG